jgi:hypothetical protein
MSNFIGLILVVSVIYFLTKTLRKFSSAWNDLSSSQQSSEEQFMKEILQRSPEPVRRAERRHSGPKAPEPRFMELDSAEAEPEFETAYEFPKQAQRPMAPVAQPAPLPEARVEAPPAPPPAFRPIDPTAPIAPATPIGVATPLSSSAPSIEKTETVQDVEKRLYIAGTLKSDGEPVAVPETPERASLVRLRNDKTMLIVPSSASASWIDNQIGRYDYICLPGKPQTRIVRRLEDFMADQIFL